MTFDWLRSLRSSSSPRRGTRLLTTSTSLESRTLLSVAPLGGETRVNSFTTGSQSTSAIATDANGNYVIAWRSDGQDGSGYGIYAQRYNAAGVAQGTEFRVNSFTTLHQSVPAIGMDADGDFVITWQSLVQDGDYWGIYAQRYNAAGVAQGSEFRVNSFTTGSQSFPRISMDADGDFVITWTSDGQDGSDWGIYAQRYNAAGVAQGSEFRVNSYTTGWQYAATISMDADGDFVITWQGDGQDGDYWGIYAQRYNAAGVAQGSEFRVNTTTTSWQEVPSIGLDAEGDFVITWMSLDQDGDGNGIYAQRYNAAGVAQGSEFRVNTTTTNLQIGTAIGVDADGDFVITWQSYGQDGDKFGVYAQGYNAAGVAQGSEFRVNSFTTDNQFLQSISMDADGDFVITWQSGGDQDGDSYGIYAQRYRLNTPKPLPNAVGAWRSGKFYLDANGNRAWNGTVSGDQLYSFGSTTDTPLVGDWNGDGITDIGTWRSGKFYLDANANHVWNGTAGGDSLISFGATTDLPIAGDWNGDGKTDIGAFRQGKFYLDANGNRQWDGTTGGDQLINFGTTGDLPVIGDWNGDGSSDIGIIRAGRFYLDANGNRVWNNLAGGDAYFNFGTTGDKPIAGDWNGDGKSDVGIVRAGVFYLDANGNRAWNNTTGGDARFAFGLATDTPLVGLWTLPAPAPLPGAVPGLSAGLTAASGTASVSNTVTQTLGSSPATSTPPSASSLAVPARKKRISGEQELVDQLFAESLSVV